MTEKGLHRYDVLDRIAVGGMAEVFLAKAYGAHGFEKTLAIKRILPELARDPEFEERFIAEAKVAVRLSHTNVVQVFDFGRMAGTLFIAMEYVDGLDLAALLRRLKQRGERIPVTAAFQIAIELARGLDFAHQHGVVHRDVSPSNILLSRAGEVKIADFGIAIAATPQRGTVTGRRKVMGKWRYMSPEQARGETLDTRSDLFSAASVIYELFTGEKLFPGDEAEEIIRNIHDMPLPRPSEVRPGLPPRLDGILHAALARSRDERPARPAVMLRALTELTYESSIVSTALDVSELVSDTVDSTTPTGKRLDAIIRAQLVGLAESTRARRTAGAEIKTAGVERKTAEGSVPSDVAAAVAIDSEHEHEHEPDDDGDGDGEGQARSDDKVADVTVAARKRSVTAPQPVLDDGDARPVLIQKIDSDGISRLELDETTIAGTPWLAMGAPPPIPDDEDDDEEDDDEDGAPDARGSRRAPPITAATTAEILPAAARRARALARARDRDGGAGATASMASSGGRTPWLVLGGTALLAAAGLAYYLTREPTPAAPAPVVAAPIDAGIDAPPARASFQITSSPSGATGTVGGQPFGPTPSSIDVAPGDVEVRLEYPGRATYVKVFTVAAGQRVLVDASLPDAPARLVVDSRPPGATVTLDGREVGKTPLTLTDLVAHQGARVTLSHPDFVTVSGTVDLVAGGERRFERTLRPPPPVMGTIKLYIEDGWAHVSLKGKPLGKAPTAALALPVGRHRLTLRDANGREWTLDVDVSASEVKYYSTRLPS